MSMDLERYGRYAAGEYLEYQKRYAMQARESDRVIIEIIRRLAAEPSERLSLVDIGCSTGNLLLHVRHHVPELHLFGGELYPAIVERCRADPDLRSITFDVMDLLHLAAGRTYDVVVVNAVLYLFGREDFEKAVTGIADVTKDGGHFITFDLFHEFEQRLEITERSETLPEGLKLHIRPFSEVRSVLARHGFADVTFAPFRIPIDLPRPARPEDMTSHTTRTNDGDRLIFRGSLYTPWCHVVARKVS